jgi:hypothetical protein
MLKEQSVKAKRSDDALEIVFKQFTTGAKLRRRMVTRQEREAMDREAALKKERDEAARALGVLRFRKAKSIDTAARKADDKELVRFYSLTHLV